MYIYHVPQCRDEYSVYCLPPLRWIAVISFSARRILHNRVKNGIYWFAGSSWLQIGEDVLLRTQMWYNLYSNNLYFPLITVMIKIISSTLLCCRNTRTHAHLILWPERQASTLTGTSAFLRDTSSTKIFFVFFSGWALVLHHPLLSFSWSLCV